MKSSNKQNIQSPSVSLTSMNSDEKLSECTDENDIMTASMQSLVDGLMTWGGKYDPQDDMSLPSGMAVSIALEESGVLGNRGKERPDDNGKEEVEGMAS